MKTHFQALALLLATACTQVNEPDYASYVDPKIGTGGHGHVFVGASVPFGMVQLGPTSIPQEWDWCSGYHDSDSTVIGFSHTHLSGTGIGDLFDITVMPVIGRTTPERGTESDPESGAWSYADRTKEVCEPGYYSVPLERYGITAELTATSRVGFHRYTFPETEDARILFDLENGGCWDKVTSSGFEIEKDEEGRIKAIGGHRYSTGWAKDQKVFFWAEFSRPAEAFTETKDYGWLEYGHADDGEQILVKVALSPNSIAGARKNMKAELDGWDFQATRTAARTAWNKELGKIDIKTRKESKRTIFYTALYHTMIAPSVFNDVDEEPAYTTFSLWDTYRAAMPLMTIIHADRMDDIVRTFWRIYKEQGDLPVWHLMGNETDCMVGNPGLIAFADAVVKGFRGGLTDEQIIEAMTATADMPDRGQDIRMKYGFIPADLYPESVANDMEYAIADGALANCAEALGKTETAKIYRERSHSYRNYWDPETRFLRGRNSDGTFKEPFDPIFSQHRVSDYTEGTGWQYLWLVPQDVNGLVSLFGSKNAFIEKLDSLFEAPDHIEGADASPDISGLIGQYAHGNEPGHHTIYLYSMLGEQRKAATRIGQVYKEMYTDAPDGLSGNEDVGQMSAWYVLSSMGFYQVEPAYPRFWFGLPNFDKMTVKVPGGIFVINREGNGKSGKIKSVTLNGAPYVKPYIEYKDIVSGGVLTFQME